MAGRAENEARICSGKEASSRPKTAYEGPKTPRSLLLEGELPLAELGCLAA